MKLPEEWYKHSAAIVPAHGQDKILLMFVAGEGARYKESLPRLKMQYSLIGRWTHLMMGMWLQQLGSF